MKKFEKHYTIVEGLSVYQEEYNSNLLETNGEDTGRTERNTEKTLEGALIRQR